MKVTLEQYFISKGINSDIAWILADAIKSAKNYKELVIKLDTIRTCVIWFTTEDWDSFKTFYSKIRRFYGKKEREEEKKCRQVLDDLLF